ncbi:MAG: cell envelope integrity protein TolA [Hyphomonadaceae bacterium]
MRAGWLVSAVGHVGFVLMTLLAWEARSTIEPAAGAVVPVEIVDVALESNVRALAEEIPEEEVAPEAAEETVEEVPEEAPAPTPEPPPERRQQREDEFDLAAIARLVDKQREPGRERNDGARADRNQRAAGPGTADAVALEDRARALARAHLRRCWRMPVDLPDPDRLVVTVEFSLNRNGTLNGQPRVTSPRNYTFDPAMRTAAEAALRAVRQCDPYPFPDDPVVGEHFDIWRETEFTFRPSL